jgi:hypothetical protein
MIFEAIPDFEINVNECWHWALKQHINVITDRHSMGVNLLAMSNDGCVLARVAMTKDVYYSLLAPQLAGVYKKLVSIAIAELDRRNNDIDLFA